MKLVSPSKVIARMNVGRSVGANTSDVIESSLDGVTPMMESVLGTSLLFTKRTDYFGHQRSIYTDYKPVTLKLAQMFVVEKTVKVYLSRTGNPITDITDTTQVLTLSAGTEYLVDALKGEVVVFSTIPRGYRTVIVTYTAGFDSEGEDIPSWLQEAAISAAVRIHHAQAVAHNKKDTRDMSRELNSIMLAQVEQYIYSGLDVTYHDMSIVK